MRIDKRRHEWLGDGPSNGIRNPAWGYMLLMLVVNVFMDAVCAAFQTSSLFVVIRSTLKYSMVLCIIRVSGLVSTSCWAPCSLMGSRC